MLFEPGNLPKGPQLQTKKALLLIDLQNDFVTSTGKLPVANTAEFLSKLPTLITAFRGKGPVVWINTIFRQPCPTISPRTGGFTIVLKGLVDHLKKSPRGDASRNASLAQDDHESTAGSTVPPTIEDDAEAFLSLEIPPAQRCCLPSSEGQALATSLSSSADRRTDIFFEKPQYSAFADFALVMELRARMVNDLYICGSLSNISVYATVLDAVQQGFNVTLVEDCLGYRDEACHIEAMTRMADDFCAQGIDYQELMDDLCGLLGDVIPASRYTRKFQLTQHTSGIQASHSQKVQTWMETIDSDSEMEKPQPTVEISENTKAILSPGRGLANKSTPQFRDSSTPTQISGDSPKQSPPRKRPTSDRDETGDGHSHRSRTSQALEGLSGSAAASSTNQICGIKKSKVEATIRDETPEVERPSLLPTVYSPGNTVRSATTGNVETSEKATLRPPSAMSAPLLSATENALSLPKSKKKRLMYDPVYLGPNDRIGDADTRIIYDVLKGLEAKDAFLKLKKEVAWQKMFQRTGEVPRLVAVQGMVDPEGAVPIYRHPADSPPPLLPFNGTVDALRQACEHVVGHQLNHVLIQYYRNGEDNISEHSDKSLDIVRGSSIVNLSLGAMRTMTLRKKKVCNPQTLGPEHNGNSTPEGTPRAAQRIRLPHNSLFVLGQRTNTNWLHSIRADKRPELEKSEEELAFGSERISLTFRRIGTFVDPQKRLIWGQGATAKIKADAKALLQGDEAERVGEQMIIGFGQENHLNDTDFDWQTVYGAGFDVVDFKITTPKA